jgi:hypothetical protein
VTAKVIPETTSKVVDGKLMRLPVRAYRAFPPGSHPAACPLIEACWAIELLTDCGSRWHGFASAAIGPDLRMHVKLLDGQERDEVIARWPDSTFTHWPKP